MMAWWLSDSSTPCSASGQTELVEELLEKKILWTDSKLITGGQPKTGEGEWWAVSCGLVGWLRECGQLVIEDIHGCWWGRLDDPEVSADLELRELTPSWAWSDSNQLIDADPKAIVSGSFCMWVCWCVYGRVYRRCCVKSGRFC